MSNTTNLALESTIIVVAGQWSQSKDLEPGIIVAGSLLAVMLAMMNTASPKLASSFAVLIFIVATLTYAVPITQKLGLVGEAP